MARITGYQIDFSGNGTSDSIFLLPGEYVVTPDLNGATFELQAKHLDQDDAKFEAQDFPDGTTTRSSDKSFRLAGGIEYRLNISGFSSAGTVYFSKAQN